MAAYDVSRGKRRIGPATGLAADLARRLEETGRPIRVGLIGSGEMGTDIVTQCQQMTGITVAAIAEINIDSARKALRIAGPRGRWPRRCRHGIRLRRRTRSPARPPSRRMRSSSAPRSTSMW